VLVAPMMSATLMIQCVQCDAWNIMYMVLPFERMICVTCGYHWCVLCQSPWTVAHGQSTMIRQHRDDDHDHDHHDDNTNDNDNDNDNEDNKQRTSALSSDATPCHQYNHGIPTCTSAFTPLTIMSDDKKRMSSSSSSLLSPSLYWFCIRRYQYYLNQSRRVLTPSVVTTMIGDDDNMVVPAIIPRNAGLLYESIMTRAAYAIGSCRRVLAYSFALLYHLRVSSTNDSGDEYVLADNNNAYAAAQGQLRVHSETLLGTFIDNISQTTLTIVELEQLRAVLQRASVRACRARDQLIKIVLDGHCNQSPTPTTTTSATATKNASNKSVIIDGMACATASDWQWLISLPSLMTTLIGDYLPVPLRHIICSYSSPPSLMPL
jgi:hypothetical protein